MNVRPASPAIAPRLRAADAELEPEDLGADPRPPTSAIAGTSSRPAEDVDDVDGHRDRLEVRVDRLAEDRRVERARVDRDDPVALALQVAHDEVARPVPVRRRADHRDRLRLRVDAPEERVRIDARRARDRAGDEGAPVGRVSHAPTIARRDGRRLRGAERPVRSVRAADDRGDHLGACIHEDEFAGEQPWPGPLPRWCYGDVGRIEGRSRDRDDQRPRARVARVSGCRGQHLVMARAVASPSQ